jgi:hypothetical protein
MFLSFRFHGVLVRRSTAYSVGLVPVFALSIHSAAAQSVAVIPVTSANGPVGVVLQGRYERFTGHSLLGPATVAETVPQRLGRRYVQLMGAKDRQGLLDLHAIRSVPPIS